MIKYSITIWNNIKALSILLIGTLIFLGIIIYLRENGIDISYILNWFWIYYVITASITIYIHLEYLLINRNDTLCIDTVNERFWLNNSPTPFNKIEKITLFLTPVLYRSDSIGLLPTDLYHYAIFKVNGKEEFIITSLMIGNIKRTLEKLPNISLEKRRCFIIASPSLLRLFTSIWHGG